MSTDHTGDGEKNATLKTATHSQCNILFISCFRHNVKRKLSLQELSKQHQSVKLNLAPTIALPIVLSTLPLCARCADAEVKHLRANNDRPYRRAWTWLWLDRSPLEGLSFEGLLLEGSRGEVLALCSIFEAKSLKRPCTEAIWALLVSNLRL